MALPPRVLRTSSAILREPMSSWRVRDDADVLGRPEPHVSRRSGITPGADSEEAHGAHRLESSCKCGVVHGAFAGSSSSAPRARSSLGEIVARYAYRHETGNLLFEAVRYLPKTFRQRRPDIAEAAALVAGRSR